MAYSRFDKTADDLLRKEATHVHFNWMSFFRKVGGEKGKEAMMNHLASMGVVAALMAAFFLAGVQAPPVREGDNFDHTGLDQQMYVVFVSFAFLLNLTSVSLVVVVYAYASLYAEDEFHLFLDSYVLLASSGPPALCVIASLAGLVAVVIRIKVVWGSPAWLIFAAGCGCVALVVGGLNWYLESSITRLRKHCHNRIADADEAEHPHDRL
eukprot:m.130359 g.130359  ORF g.130359 m.130359 type:complete len:210 (+) comp16785_c1_seq2:198-827(+)